MRSLCSDERFSQILNFAKAYTGLGTALYFKGNYKIFVKEELLDSVKLLADQALQLDSNTDEAYFLLGSYFIHKGNNEEGMAAFHSALKINPNYADVMMELGFFNTAIVQDFVTGLSQMHQAVQRNRGPELATYLHTIGFIYSSLGMFDKAKEVDDKATLLDGDTTSRNYHRSMLYRYNRQYEDALNLLNALYLQDSSYFGIYDDRAHLLSDLGRYKEALDIRLRWRKSHPDDPISDYHRIGFLYSKLGDEKTARKYFDEMIAYCEESIRLKQIQAQWKGTQYDLAGMYAYLGDKEKAFRYLEEVNNQKLVPYWLFALMKEDQLFDPIRHDERYKKIERDMEDKLKFERGRVQQWLDTENLTAKIEAKR
ncbi:MAG: hypothetical protein QM762_09820 [Chryseolinea sp.]